MKKLHLLSLLFFALTATGQNLNTLVLKRTFRTEEELVKTYPQLIKPKLLLEKGSIKVLDNKNAVKKQVPRSSIPSNLNAFIFSPSGEYFVAYEETEVHTTDLYFYRSDGSFLAKQKIDIYPNIKFSNSGEYVIAFNFGGCEIFVFDKQGAVIFFDDYLEMIKDKTKVLDNVLISEDGGEILINAGNNLYSFDLKDKNKIFASAIGGEILDAAVYSEIGIIALKIIIHGVPNGKYNLKVLSKIDGKVVAEISNLNMIEFISSGVILSSNSNFLEYAFKR